MVLQTKVEDELILNGIIEKQFHFTPPSPTIKLLKIDENMSRILMPLKIRKCYLNL